MNNPLPPFKKTASYRAYQRDLRRQIIFPMIIVALLFVAASVAAALRGNETASQWADVSAVWLLIPVITFSMINIIILAALIYGITKLLGITPIYAHKLQGFIRLVGEKIAGFADTAAKPVITAGGFFASLRRLFRQK